MAPYPRLRRLQIFKELVFRKDHSGRRISIRQAWRVAGIASGEIEAIPDGVLAWWWKMQDLVVDTAPEQDAGSESRREDSAR